MTVRRFTIIWLLGLLVLGSMSTAAAQVSVTYPELSGAYPVGRITYHLIDEDRPETLTPDDDSDVRELLVRVYYPAEPEADAEVAPFVDKATANAIAADAGVPVLIVNMFKSRAYEGAPSLTTDTPYPVVLFSPGYGAPIQVYTALAEEIASHGYIVVTLTHPYCTSGIAYPDGHTAKLNMEACDLSNDTIEELGAIWVADARFVVDELERLNAEDEVLKGMLDLEHVGMFGHSFGGATAAQTAYEDDRVDAAVDMDGTFFGDVSREGSVKPLMLMRSADLVITDAMVEASGMTRAEFEAIIAEGAAKFDTVLAKSSESYRFQLANSQHNTYMMDLALAAPTLPFLFPPEMVGAIEGARAFEIISTYLLAFFDTYLKGETVALLDGASSDYPEVSFEVLH
jgi:dienelactone hydrolase